MVKCYDVCKMVMDETTARLALSYTPNDELIAGIWEICADFDRLVKDCDGESFTVEVNEEDMSIDMILECDGVEATSVKDPLCRLIRVAQKFSFSATKDSSLHVEFTFPGVWKHIE